MCVHLLIVNNYIHLQNGEIIVGIMTLPDKLEFHGINMLTIRTESSLKILC
jgi:hypothetical protein